MEIDIRKSLNAGEPGTSRSRGPDEGPFPAAAKGRSCWSADRITRLAAMHLFSPLQGMDLACCSQVLRPGWKCMGPAYWPRALLLSASSLFNASFGRYEDGTYRRALKDVVVPPPLFILGHYRSGTTHLQHLLTLNRAFAYPNLYQSFFPHTFLSTERYLAPLVQLALVRRRFQDRVPLSVKSPMEDEIALCVSTGLSPHMELGTAS